LLIDIWLFTVPMSIQDPVSATNGAMKKSFFFAWIMLAVCLPFLNADNDRQSLGNLLRGLEKIFFLC